MENDKLKEVSGILLDMYLESGDPRVRKLLDDTMDLSRSITEENKKKTNVVGPYDHIFNPDWNQDRHTIVPLKNEDDDIYTDGTVICTDGKQKQTFVRKNPRRTLQRDSEDTVFC